MELIFQEGDYLVKTLATHEEMDEAFRLRHEVFCDELKWVPASPDGMEKDAYDAFAHPIGVFNENNRLIGYVRLITAPNPFMIEKEFASLLPKDRPFIKLPNMAEVTRICVKKEHRTILLDSSLTLCHLLYKAFYQWSLLENIRFLVAVAEKKSYRYFKLCLPFKPAGAFLPMSDGVMAGVILLDWRNFESFAQKTKPEFFQWMTTLPSLVPSRLQQHGLYLQHPI